MRSKDSDSSDTILPSSDAGFQFAEVPVHHFHRTYGKSQFFNFRRLSRVLPHVAWLWWKLVVRREHIKQIAARRANVKLKIEN